MSEPGLALVIPLAQDHCLVKSSYPGIRRRAFCGQKLSRFTFLKGPIRTIQAADVPPAHIVFPIIAGLVSVADFITTMLKWRHCYLHYELPILFSAPMVHQVHAHAQLAKAPIASADARTMGLAEAHSCASTSGIGSTRPGHRTCGSAAWRACRNGHRPRSPWLRVAGGHSSAARVFQPAIDSATSCAYLRRWSMVLKTRPTVSLRPEPTALTSSRRYRLLSRGSTRAVQAASPAPPEIISLNGMTQPETKPDKAMVPWGNSIRKEVPDGRR